MVHIINEVKFLRRKTSAETEVSGKSSMKAVTKEPTRRFLLGHEKAELPD